MYRVNLDNFEGPLDLLLFFIKRDEIDIYDIPISYITEEFLAYIRYLEELDIEVAGDFILMASTLMAIKAKYLIPQATEQPIDEVLEEDPRLELTRQLLEYKRFKEVAIKMRHFEEAALKQYRKGIDLTQNISQEDSAIEALKEITVFDLMNTFKALLEKAEVQKPIHTVKKRVTTIAKQSAFIKRRLAELGRTSFKTVVEELEDKLVLVTTFLAVLDLAKEGAIWIFVKDDTNEFAIELRRIK